MIEKDKLPEWIDRYNNNELHGRELEEFIELMKNDPELRRDVRLDKDLNEILSESDIIDLRKKIIKNRIPKEKDHHGLTILLFAATGLILIGLAVLIYIWLRSTDNEIMKSHNEFNFSDTITITGKINSANRQLAHDPITIDSIMVRNEIGELRPNDLILTDDYTVFLPYEGLVGEVTRTGYFQVIKPKNNDTYDKGSSLTFSWKTKSSQSIIITILNNKGEPVYISPLISDTDFVYNTSALSAGLYYFKLTGHNEILYFGKFTLE